MIVVPELLESLKSKLMEVMLGGFVKPRKELTYDVVILSFMPDPKLSEGLGEKVYVVRAVLVGSEEGGTVDYDSMSFIRRKRIDFALPFKAVVNDDLDVLGIEVMEESRE